MNVSWYPLVNRQQEQRTTRAAKLQVQVFRVVMKRAFFQLDYLPIDIFQIDVLFAL